MINLKKVMTRDVITIGKEDNIIDAERIITSKNVSGIVVVDNGMPIGVVDHNEIIKGILTKKRKVKEIMDMNFVVVSPLTKFSEIVSYMRHQNARRFTVVENGKLIGLITETDIIESVRDFTKFDQTVQEAILVIFGLATAFFLLYFSPFSSSLFA